MLIYGEMKYGHWGSMNGNEPMKSPKHSWKRRGDHLL